MDNTKTYFLLTFLILIIMFGTIMLTYHNQSKHLEEHLDKLQKVIMDASQKEVRVQTEVIIPKDAIRVDIQHKEP